jgi:hypothetical protein
MGHKLKIKSVDSRVNVHNLSSTGVPFTLTTVQVPNLARTHKKRITVYLWLTYMYAHVGMPVCTRIMLVCKRRSLQGVGSSRLHSSIFYRSRKRRGNTKKTVPGEIGLK